MIDEYFRRIARSRTLNELNAAHLSMCNVMTPIEALFLLRTMSEPGWTFPGDAVDAMQGQAFGAALVKHMTMMVNDLGDTGKERAEPFGRERLIAGMWRFSSGGGERADKTLLISFTGNAALMMMPCPTYLQHFDANKVDIVLLMDPAKSGYRGGIPPVGHSFVELVDAMPELLSIGQYRRLSVAGTSGGALPAVLAGFRLRAHAVLAVGGNSPDDDRWDAVEGTGARNLLVEWAGASPGTKVTLAAGAQSARDVISAEATMKLIKAEFIKVTDPDQPVKHNAAYPLVRQKKFAAFAREHLGLD